MKIIQRLIKILLPLAFGVCIILFLLNNVDKQRLMYTVQHGIHWSWVLISWGFALLANVARGVRWRQQLRTEGINPTLHEMSVSFFGNYGFGEFWRCNYIAQIAKRPFFSIGGTILSERLCDILCSIAFVILAFALQYKQFLQAVFHVDDVADQSLGDEMEEAAASSGFPWGWLLLAVAVIVLLVFAFSKKARRMNPIESIKRTCKNMWAGFCTLKKLENKWSYFFWSIFIWVLYYFNTLTQFYFFDFTQDLGLLPCLCVFVMGTVAQILPIQGGLGAWQLLVISALLVYGVGFEDATNFAIVAWLLEQIFVLLMGFYALMVVAINKK